MDDERSEPPDPGQEGPRQPGDTAPDAGSGDAPDLDAFDLDELDLDELDLDAELEGLDLAVGEEELALAQQLLEEMGLGGVGSGVAEAAAADPDEGAGDEEESPADVDDDEDGGDLDDEVDLDDDDLEDFDVGGSVEAACPHCGEMIEFFVDPAGGAYQEYVEDCPVCCRSSLARVTVDRDGVSTVELDPID